MGLTPIVRFSVTPPTVGSFSELSNSLLWSLVLKYLVWDCFAPLACYARGQLPPSAHLSHDTEWQSRQWVEQGDGWPSLTRVHLNYLVNRMSTQRWWSTKPYLFRVKHKRHNVPYFIHRGLWTAAWPLLTRLIAFGRDIRLSRRRFCCRLVVCCVIDDQRSRWKSLFTRHYYSFLLKYLSPSNSLRNRK